MRAVRALRACSRVLLASSPTAVFGQADATARTGNAGLPLSASLMFAGPWYQELDALTSTKFPGARKARTVVLTTYRELIAKQGLKAMRRPAG